MNKNQQLLLGVGVLAVAGYLIWQQSQKPKSFANVIAGSLGAPDCGEPGTSNPNTGCKCPCANPVGTANDGTILCANGHTCCGNVLGPCPPGGGPKPKGTSLMDF